MKERKTIEIWRNIIENDLAPSLLDYNFRQLEPYLDVFHDVPYEYKEDVLEKFHGLLFVYLLDNRPLGVPTHNKIMTKALYKDISKNNKIAKDFLALINREKINTLKNMKIDIENFINENNKLLNSKAVTKIQIKAFLQKVNKNFNLKKSLELKQLTDII